MHIRNSKTKSKSEAMYFPPSLAEAKELGRKKVTPKDIVLPQNNERISFISHFKYKNSIIMPLLKVKHQIYTAGPLNA
jgi:hypothetical protein